MFPTITTTYHNCPTLPRSIYYSSQRKSNCVYIAGLPISKIN